MLEGGLDGGFFAVYIPQGPLTDAGRVAARKAAHKRLDEIQAVVEQHADQLEIARSAADARRIAKSGKRFVFLSMENGYPVGETPELLADFQARGVRMAGPIHFRNNDLGTSSTDLARPDLPGLTAAGRNWVSEANRLGILIDFSHASDSSARRHPCTVLEAHRALALRRQGGVPASSQYRRCAPASHRGTGRCNPDFCLSGIHGRATAQC